MVEIERLRGELDQANRRVVDLEIALQSNREIATAVGIVMATYHVADQQAFRMLSETSQHTKRKLRDVVYTGSFTQARPASDTPTAST